MEYVITQHITGGVELENGIKMSWMEFVDAKLSRPEAEAEAMRLVCATNPHVTRCWCDPATLQYGDIVRTVETRKVGVIVDFCTDGNGDDMHKVEFIDLYAILIAGQSVAEARCPDDCGWYVAEDLRRNVLGTAGVKRDDPFELEGSGHFGVLKSSHRPA